jgi:hypothetical protein
MPHLELDAKCDANLSYNSNICRMDDLGNPMRTAKKSWLQPAASRASAFGATRSQECHGFSPRAKPPLNSCVDYSFPEIFDARTHTSVGVIGSSGDLLEIDFANGKITQVGDQYGIGRR